MEMYFSTEYAERCRNNDDEMIELAKWEFIFLLTSWNVFLFFFLLCKFDMVMRIMTFSEWSSSGIITQGVSLLKINWGMEDLKVSQRDFVKQLTSHLYNMIVSGRLSYCIQRHLLFINFIFWCNLFIPSEWVVSSSLRYLCLYALWLSPRLPALCTFSNHATAWWSVSAWSREPDNLECACTQTMSKSSLRLLWCDACFLRN